MLLDQVVKWRGPAALRQDLKACPAPASGIANSPRPCRGVLNAISKQKSSQTLPGSRCAFCPLGTVLSSMPSAGLSLRACVAPAVCQALPAAEAVVMAGDLVDPQWLVFSLSHLGTPAGLGTARVLLCLTCSYKFLADPCSGAKGKWRFGPHCSFFSPGSCIAATIKI